MITKFLHALFGAFLGALTALSALFWFHKLNWIFVCLCAGVCAVLAFAWGEPFLDWLKENWWKT